jgi:hypothetical protein
MLLVDRIPELHLSRGIGRPWSPMDNLRIRVCRSGHRVVDLHLDHIAIVDHAGYEGHLLVSYIQWR